MAYVKNTWATGDVVTSSKLNNIENGIADGGVLVVNGTIEGSTMTLDKTWQEMYDATAPMFINASMAGAEYKVMLPVVGIFNINGHTVNAIGTGEGAVVYEFVAEDANDYPSVIMGE